MEPDQPQPEGSPTGPAPPGATDPPRSPGLFEGRGHVSSRRLDWKRRLILALTTPLVALGLKLLWATWRVKKVEGAEHLEPFLGERTCVPCVWHSHIVAVYEFLRHYHYRGLKGCMLLSPSMDGEFVAQVASKFGARIVRGSSTRSGAKAFRALYEIMVEEGYSPVIHPDGPRGPARVFKKGAIVLAQKTGAPILPVTWAVSGAWHLPSWDRTIFPRPFTKITYVVGEPIYVPADLDSPGIEAETERITAVLNALTARAEALLQG